MPEKKQNRFPVTIYLTAEQIKDIFRQLRNCEEDWIDDPQITLMLEDLAMEAEEELIKGETVSLESLKLELGM